MSNQPPNFASNDTERHSPDPSSVIEAIEFTPTSSFLQNILESLSVPREVQTSDRTPNATNNKRRTNGRQSRAVSSTVRPSRRPVNAARHQSRKSVGNVPVSPIEALASVAAQENSGLLERPSKRAKSEHLPTPQLASREPQLPQTSRPATSHIPAASWGHNLEQAIDNAQSTASRSKSLSNAKPTDVLSAAESLLELFHSNTPRIPPTQQFTANGQTQHISPLTSSNGFSNSIWNGSLPYVPNDIATHVQSLHASPEYMEGVETASAMQTHTPPEDLEAAIEDGVPGIHESTHEDVRNPDVLDHRIQRHYHNNIITRPPEQLHSPQSLPSAPEIDELKGIGDEQIQRALTEAFERETAHNGQEQPETSFAHPLSQYQLLEQGLGISVSTIESKAINGIRAQDDIDDSQATVSVEGDAQTTMDEETKCAACGFFANSLAGETILWTQCDGPCQNWYHVSCTKVKPKEISRIDKFHCPECEKTLGPSTFFRKSARNRTNVDYKGLNEGTFSTVEENYEHRYIKHFKDGTLKYVMAENFPRLRAEDVTAEYLQRLPSFCEPMVIPAELNPRPGRKPVGEDGATGDVPLNIPVEADFSTDMNAEATASDFQDGLDMVIPDGLTVRRVAELHGVDMPLEVIDVKAQEGDQTKKWTVGKWADYYEAEGEKPIRNVISLEVSRSRLGRLLRRPRAVRQLDLQDAVWPSTDLARVPVKFYVLMSVADCYTDFHIDFGGSSVYYHILKGRKVFFFIPPTASNLKKYEQWNKTAAQGHTFLPDQTKECYRVDLYPGDTMLIPSGWIHAVWTPTDSLVIGGNYLTKLHLGMQIKIHEIEKACGVPIKYRYPHFQKVMWYLLIHYLDTDPLPASVEDLILNKGQPFLREQPIWEGSQPIVEDPELFNARYYAKSEIEGWPDLIPFVYRTALIHHDRVDGMSKESRAAVMRSIPKTHGDPLDLVRKFAGWVAWKTGNVLPPDWVYSESALPTRSDGKAEKDFKPATATRKNPERTSHRLGPKKVVCDTCREKKIACKHVDASGIMGGPTPGLAASTSSNSERPSPPAPSTPKMKASSVDVAMASLEDMSDITPMTSASAKRDKESTGKAGLNGEGKRRWGKACVDCRRSKRRCIHDENGQIDPNKQNAPAKGESRGKRKNSSADETLLDGSLLDDTSMLMDLDIEGEPEVEVEAEVKTEVSKSVEDSAIDPALMAYALPTKQPIDSSSAASPPVNDLPRQSPTSARSIKPISTPQTSPTAARAPRRSSSLAKTPGVVGASMSPGASRRGSKGSPIVPQGLTPEEEANWRLAIQLQAEEFGLRSRRSG